MVDETFWSWLAGFIDGEGYFVLSKNKNLRYPNTYQWIPRIVVSQNDVNTLNFIKKQSGFGIVYERKGSKRERSQLYLTQRKVFQILPRILPYLKVKKKKAKLLYEACKIITNGKKWGGIGRPTWEIRKLENIAHKIKKTENKLIKEEEKQYDPQTKLFEKG